VEKLDEQESMEYFHSRPHGSQVCMHIIIFFIDIISVQNLLYLCSQDRVSGCN